MLIEGYHEGGPLTAGEPLAARPGFRANHLLRWCAAGPGGERPEAEWFGDDGADTEALAEVLYDEWAWPVLRVPFGDGNASSWSSGVVLVFRNRAGDPGAAAAQRERLARALDGHGEPSTGVSSRAT